ncbi:unnamed protein product [Bemisia tabaci]|uniref:Cyclin-Q n=1 Tax=Bemisia tabaci TaxID=7038 RepID=A0A9P0G5I8_BEMTA|nr:PREDICTED: cyclin-related protein FAM58A [Bemisia tabaci]CAH0773282.1 unnamed protein product [Bemisia tabaci]
MKGIIDVLQLQIERERVKPIVQPIDYTQHNSTFYGARYIFECGYKLNMQPLTIATAATIFHRFFKKAELSSYDVYLIAATSLYIAGKTKDDAVKIRDVINVANNTLHRGSPPLDLNDEYWSMRDAIVQAELLLMRMVRFEVTHVHPHKYLLHFYKSLQGWLSPSDWRETPLIEAAYAFLQDFHHSSVVLYHKPQHIAVACLNLAMQVYGIQVPCTDETERTWYSVFVNDLLNETLWEIMESIMDVYSKK